MGAAEILAIWAVLDACYDGAIEAWALYVVQQSFLDGILLPVPILGMLVSCQLYSFLW